jgi:hypothetical protein
MLLTEKWGKELTSDKFPTINESDMGQMALILENTKADEKLLTERSEASDIAQFTPVLIPLVRRVFPNLIAQHITGVQAMKTPTAYIYALAYKYLGNGTQDINAKDVAQIISVDTALTVGDAIKGDASAAEGVVLFVENGGLTALVKVTTSATFIEEAITKGGNAAGTVSAVWSNDAMFGKLLTGYTGPYATSVGEDLNNDMNEIGYTIDRAILETKSRKLKGSYTVELLQDMKSMHGLDAEKEMSDLMGMELQYETDSQAIAAVRASAAAASDAVVAGYGRWDVEKFRSLGIKVSNEAREIGRKIRKGSANTLMVSPKSSVALEVIGSFVQSPTNSKLDAVSGGFKPEIGTFDNRYKTVVDNISSGESVTAMYKGASNKDSGVFMGVYSGANLVKVTDPKSGNPAAILTTRNGFIENPQSPEAYTTNFSVNFTGTVLA